MALTKEEKASIQQTVEQLEVRLAELKSNRETRIVSLEAQLCVKSFSTDSCVNHAESIGGADIAIAVCEDLLKSQKELLK